MFYTYLKRAGLAPEKSPETDPRTLAQDWVDFYITADGTEGSPFGKEPRCICTSHPTPKKPQWGHLEHALVGNKS